MFKSLLTITAVIILLICQNESIMAQAITADIEREIHYKAKATIETLETILNTIADTSILSTQRNTVITNSFDPSSKERIFWNKKIIVEEDLDPNALDYKKAVDRDIEKYLKSIQTVYNGSTESSIFFTNMINGSVKRKNYIYTRVYFESKFNNTHKVIKAPYQKTQRVATLRAEKDGSQWRTYIIGISFFQPNDYEEFFSLRNLIKEITHIPQQQVVDSSIYISNKVTSIVSNPLGRGFVNFTQPQKAYKRGRSYPIEWKAGTSSAEAVKIDLYKGSQRQLQVYSGDNRGKYNLPIPKVKPGRNYSLRLTHSSGATRTLANSSTFRIKRRTPWILKPLILVGAGAGAYLIICPDGCNGPKPEYLPDPWLPGAN